MCNDNYEFYYAAYNTIFICTVLTGPKNKIKTYIFIYIYIQKNLDFFFFREAS